MIYNVDKRYIEWLRKNPGINPSKQLLVADLGLTEKGWNDIKRFNKWLEEEFENYYLLMEKQEKEKFKQAGSTKAWSYVMGKFEEEYSVAPRWYNKGVRAWVTATFREHEILNDRNLMQNLFSVNRFMGKMALFGERPSFATKMMMHSTVSLMKQLGMGMTRLLGGNDDYVGDKPAKNDINVLIDGSDKLDKELDKDNSFKKAEGEFESFYKYTVDELNKSKKGITAAHINEIDIEANKLGYEREEFIEALVIYFAARGVNAEIMNEDIIFSRQDNMFA
jgi:hypothetical protein